MSIRMRDAMGRVLGELRHEPTEKRIRAAIAGHPVVDSRRAMLVWESRRIVPGYAVPIADVAAELTRAAPSARAGDAAVGGPPVLHPGIPFHVRDGEAFDITVAGETRAGAAFSSRRRGSGRSRHPRPARVRRVVGGGRAGRLTPEGPLSPRRRPAQLRHVRIELDGHVLAESHRPALLFETSLPVRFYLPPGDVSDERRPSATRSYCPYKGEASYWSFPGGADLAWTYGAPLPDCPAIAGLVAFFDEHVDVVVDGERRGRPQTEWSRREAG